MTPMIQTPSSLSEIFGLNLSIAALQTILSYTVFANITESLNQGLGNLAAWTQKLHPMIHIAKMMTKSLLMLVLATCFVIKT